MYTFDLFKADLLIQLANAAAPHRDKAAGTNFTRISEVAITSLEKAQKLIIESKPEVETK